MKSTKTKQFSTIGVLSMLLAALLLLSSCGGASGTKGVEYTDPSGATIAVPKTVKSVVSLAPAITQIILDLGAGDILVAVDTQSQMMYPEVADLPAYDMMAPDFESIILQTPDLVLGSGLTGEGAESPFAPLLEANIAVGNYPTPDTVQGIIEGVRFTGEVIGKKEATEALLKTMEEDIKKVTDIAATITEKKSVYFEIAALPDLYSFGNGVFLNEMIEMLGAENIFADQSGWLAVTEEDVVQKNPQVILSSVTYIENPLEEILSREGWESMEAIQQNAVFSIDPNASSQPNHHIVEALLEMAAAVYPEEYSEL